MPLVATIELLHLPPLLLGVVPLDPRPSREMLEHGAVGKVNWLACLPEKSVSLHQGIVPLDPRPSRALSA